MKHATEYPILRVAVAITFLWIGILIFREPEFWGGFLKPWAAGILPFSLEEAMIGTAMLDILIGFFLLIDVLTWLAALVGSAHLLLVLIVSGIDPITVRDIGLLGATIALTWASLPEKMKKKMKAKKPLQTGH